MATRPEKVTVREDTPTPYASGPTPESESLTDEEILAHGPTPESESLTDEEILAQIKYLHSLLRKRRQNGSKRLLSANSSSDEERPSLGKDDRTDLNDCSPQTLPPTRSDRPRAYHH
ncbi:hypothetical protein QE152_g10045 [Popillia japonica]